MALSEMERMHLLIGIDDTDTPGSKGTGSIASEMLDLIETNGWGKCGFVTRHQLYLQPDIPYTSHNSSMIFDADINPAVYPQLIEMLNTYLKKESAEGSDPGLCVAQLDRIQDIQGLIKFGRLAKCRVMTKDLAFAQAERSCVYLTEKGGSGLGVIGALAGVALRLEGNDGEVKGGLKKYVEGQRYSVAELVSHKKIDKVLSTDLTEVPDHDHVMVVWKVKPIIMKGRPVLLVKAGAAFGEWLTMEKDAMRKFGDERSDITPCDLYQPDVSEEQVFSADITCLNCAFRRWTETSFDCLKK